MASRIIILDDATASKIAAGEVVERPSSIVKELVENSIDAGAGKIEIEIKNGGRDLIRITDDGCGMNEEEAKLSVERHSTSKIKNADDLFSIKTLGFRGEALPSIASVSKFELITKELMSSEEFGITLKINGGKIEGIEKTGAPYGTTVIVKDLFFNTPARLKFLKSTNTEFSHIVDSVSKFIIAYPRIMFKLLHNDKLVLDSPGKSELIDALGAVYGAETAKHIIPISYSSDDLKICGYISDAQTVRLDRYMESFFVNGRYVKNFILSKALEDGYKNIIPSDRYPIAAVFIEINPSVIDINVHPSKREVKFSNSLDLTKALKEVVCDSLSAQMPNSQDDIQFNQEFKPDFIQPALIENIQTSTGSNRQNYAPYLQIDKNYIVTSINNELTIIDQHAAHERILFEKLKSNGSNDASQKLLVAETIELTPHEASVLEVNLKFLGALGFEIEAFGKNTYIIRSIPDIISRENIKQIISDIISEFISLDRSVEFDVIVDRVKKLIACHGAVKMGDILNENEVRSLIEEMGKTPNSTTCPHGRPTVKTIDKKELEKMFGRR